MVARMQRREFIGSLAASAFARPLAAQAQQNNGRVYRVGILWPVVAKGSERLEYFRNALQEVGYVEGKNIVLIDRSTQRTERNTESWTPALAELVEDKVDVIVTAGTSATVAAQRTSGTVPVVMTSVSDPIGAGVVASLARPGGRVTGLTNFGPELSGKWLELIKELAPTTARILILFDAAVRPVVRGMPAAAAAGVAIEPIEIASDDQLRDWLAVPMQSGIDGLIVFLPPDNAEQRDKIIQFAASHRLPAIYWWREYVDGGGLIYYGPELRDMYRRAAAFVDKILKGAKPRELPVEQPTRLDLIINLKTARALGFSVSPSLIARADKVIE
jgi:putative ABC transport system substrate-binding protein